MKFFNELLGFTELTGLLCISVKLNQSIYQERA